MDANRFSILDWIGAWFAGLTGLALLVFPFLIAPHFARMFAEFATTLPLVTRLALTSWLTPLAGASVLGALAAGISRRSRTLAFAAFVWGSLWIAATLVALYLPIFELAGNIE